MTRRVAPLAVLIAVLAAAAPAGAAVTELGQDPDLGQPSCPGKPCLAVGRTTGLQSKVGATLNPLAAPRDGRIVAFTLRLSAPTDRQVAFFSKQLGGAPSARLSVLKPSKDRRRYRLVAQSEVVKLKPYLGQTAQFPLASSLPIVKGQVVGVTFPTWAPALVVGRPRADGWRASRPASGCTDTFGATQIERLEAVKTFPCLYRSERIAYTATLISTP